MRRSQKVRKPPALAKLFFTKSADNFSASHKPLKNSGLRKQDSSLTKLEAAKSLNSQAAIRYNTLFLIFKFDTLNTPHRPNPHYNTAQSPTHLQLSQSLSPIHRCALLKTEHIALLAKTGSATAKAQREHYENNTSDTRGRRKRLGPQIRT